MRSVVWFEQEKNYHDIDAMRYDANINQIFDIMRCIVPALVDDNVL